MKIKDIIKLIISLIIISAILYYLFSRHYFDVAGQISLTNWAILTGLTLLSYLASGLQMYFLIKHVSGTGLRLTDVLFMPMSMSLFSYFIPTNGGFLYSMYFMKKKYRIETSHSFSVGVASIYLSFILSGLALLITGIVLGNTEYYIIIISLLLILSPVLVYYFNKLVQKIPLKSGSLAERVKCYLDSVVLNSHRLMVSRRLILINAGLTLLALIILFLIYFWINKTLKMELPLLSIIALIATMRVSGLIRLLPGNLGLEELFTAGLFGIVGQNPALGLVFSVFFRFCTFVIMIPAGVIHTAFNVQYFSFKDVRKLLVLNRKKGSTEEPAEHT